MSYYVTFVTFAWGILSAYGILSTVNQCQTIKLGCSCRLNNGSVINITTAGNTNQTARFSSTASLPSSNITYKYYYNPCYNFTQGQQCRDVAACQNDPGSAMLVPIGLQKNSAFLVSPDGKLYVQYRNDPKDDPFKKNRTTRVELVCSSETHFSATGDVTEAYTYVMSLKCPEACARTIPTRPPPGGAKSGLSLGSIIVIVFFCGVCLYFVIGMLAKGYISGATGTEMIPNRQFWVDLPGLVKDGIVFSYHCVCGRRHGYESTN